MEKMKHTNDDGAATATATENDDDNYHFQFYFQPQERKKNNFWKVNNNWKQVGATLNNYLELTNAFLSFMMLQLVVEIEKN